MKRAWLAFAVAVVSTAGVFSVTTVSAGSDADGADAHNMRLLANWDDDGKYRNGTDMAFWGNTLLLGRLDQSSQTNRVIARTTSRGLGAST